MEDANEQIRAQNEVIADLRRQLAEAQKLLRPSDRPHSLFATPELDARFVAAIERPAVVRVAKVRLRRKTWS